MAITIASRPIHPGVSQVLSTNVAEVETLFAQVVLVEDLVRASSSPTLGEVPDDLDLDRMIRSRSV